MRMRKGAARGTGRGYKNLRGFPKDSIVHSDSGKGRKQPQRVLLRVNYLIDLRKIEEQKINNEIRKLEDKKDKIKKLITKAKTDFIIEDVYMLEQKVKSINKQIISQKQKIEKIKEIRRKLSESIKN